MAFNVDRFVKNTAKTVGQRIVNDVVTRATSGLPMNILSSASSTAQSLFNAGASFESISSLTSQRTDSLVNKGADVYYALAGKDPARVSSVVLRELRSVGSDTASFHVNNINPSSAISAKRKRDAEVIINAVI